MKKSDVDEKGPPPTEQSLKINIEDIKHEQPQTSSNIKQLDDVQPGGSKPKMIPVQPDPKPLISIFNANKDIGTLHSSSAVTVVKNKEPIKSESAKMSEGTSISPKSSGHSTEYRITEELPSMSDNEDPNATSLREMFPDLPISDENLSLKRLQQMSTTDITREIVSLNKPAILKPTVRLIPHDKTWLSPLQEVDKQQEAEAEKEIVQWEKETTNHKYDSESDEEIEETVDLENDELSKTNDDTQK